MGWWSIYFSLGYPFISMINGIYLYVVIQRPIDFRGAKKIFDKVKLRKE